MGIMEILESTQMKKLRIEKACSIVLGEDYNKDFIYEDVDFTKPSTIKKAYEVFEASMADIKKVLAAAKKAGADIKGNKIDFGAGSLIDVSLEKGKIKFDGGMSTGVEYFNNAKDAIMAFESTDLEEAKVVPFKSLEQAWSRTGGDKDKQVKLIKKYDLKKLISSVRPGEIKLGIKNKLLGTTKAATAAGLDSDDQLIFITNNPLKIIYPKKSNRRPEGEEIKESVKAKDLEEAKNATVRELRQMLFKIDSSAADKLRRELFNIDKQDSPATNAQIKKAKKIIGNRFGKDAFVQLEAKARKSESIEESNKDKYMWGDINNAMSGSGLNPRVIMNVLSKLKGKSQN